MQVTHVIHDGFGPLVFEAVVSQRRLTLRAWREVQNVKDPKSILTERPAFLFEQAKDPAWNYQPVVMQGALLDQRLSEQIILLAGQATLDLDSKDIAAEVSDYGCWVFFATLHGELLAPFNRFAATAVNKVSVRAHGERQGMRRVLTIWQRFAGDTFDQMAFHQYHHRQGFFVGLPEPTAGTPQVNFHPSLPRLQLVAPLGVEPGGYQTVSVKMVDSAGALIEHDATVYLEATAGYLAKTRVDLKAGVGSFKVMALGLDKGDVMEIRAGFKFVSNLASHTLVVG